MPIFVAPTLLAERIFVPLQTFGVPDFLRNLASRFVTGQLRLRIGPSRTSPNRLPGLSPANIYQ